MAIALLTEAQIRHITQEMDADDLAEIIDAMPEEHVNQCLAAFGVSEKDIAEMIEKTRATILKYTPVQGRA